MIIPCINSTSFGERGGSVALVDGGSVRVGWPGAPGCTTTGVAGSACCAQTGSENKPARVVAATSPLRHAATPLTDRSLGLPLKCKDLIGVEWSSTEGFTLSQSTAKGTWVRPAIRSKISCDNGLNPRDRPQNETC